MERPVSAVQRVFLDEVQIIHAGDLHAEETKHATFTVTAKSHIFYPPITCARLNKEHLVFVLHKRKITS